MVNALGDLSLISKRDGGGSDRDALDALREQGERRSVSTASSYTERCRGDTGSCGSVFERQTK